MIIVESRQEDISNFLYFSVCIYFITLLYSTTDYPFWLSIIYLQQEENNVLKLQLDELNLKLRRADVNISRAKEELAWYRASSGKNQHSNFEKMHHLSTKLKETEEDRMQLGKKLLCLSTSILKVSGHHTFFHYNKLQNRMLTHYILNNFFVRIQKSLRQPV